MVSLWRCVGLLAVGLASPLAAQPAPEHKPYKPVEVTLPAAATDKSLEAFRNAMKGEPTEVRSGAWYPELAPKGQGGQ